MESIEQQPAYGQRLLPAILDEDAQTRPDRIFAAIPRGTDLCDGFLDITVAQMATAVDFVAYQLQSEYGISRPEGHQTLTYIGLPDLRYNIVFYAAVKCGYKTKSSKLVYSDELLPLISGLRAERPNMHYWAVDSIGSLLQVKSHRFPYHYNFDQAKDHQILVLHSSGSTGLPKPVTMTHASFAVMDNDRNFPSIPGRKNHDLSTWEFQGDDARIYEPFPPFHLGGFFIKITLPLFTHTIPVFGPPSRPPSGALVAEIVREQKLRGLFLPPVVAEHLLHEVNGVDYFRDLDIFCFAGGPLSQAAGDKISTVTTVCQFYGATEIGQVRQLVPDHKEWPYMEFHPLEKLRFEPAEDDAYELVVLADFTTAGQAALNYNYPGVNEWRTRDLFRPHPTRKALWSFYGRRDDIIVLSSGEKFNPVPTETSLLKHPFIAGALVVGQGRPRPSLLVEAKAGVGSPQTIREQIWPAIEAENLRAPSHGRIAKSLVHIANPETPFVRAGKGTIIRKLTGDAFKAEIEERYINGVKPASVGKSISLRAPRFQPEAVTEFVRSALQQVLPNAKLQDTDNVYSFGLDSLKTSEFAEMLRVSLCEYRQPQELSWITTETVYTYPTIQDISREILAYLNEGRLSKPPSREVLMSTILKDLINGLSASVPSNPNAPAEAGLSLVLTGSTGWLGIHLLELLATERGIAHIRCLNRSTDAAQQWQSHLEKRMKKEYMKVRFDIPGDSLGLNDHELSSIRAETDLIIHNAWKVDFNQPVSAFTDNLRSVQTLANLSASTPRRPHIVFISSVSSCAAWRPSTQQQQDTFIPESAIEDLNAALELGYAESKLIAEQLLDTAARKQDIPVTILRVGQIAGPSRPSETSIWPERDAVVAMLKTSKSMAMIPNDIVDVDWIPIDKVSRAIIDIVIPLSQTDLSKASYFNLVNPTPVPWHNFLNPLKEFCGPDAQIVPHTQWIKKLQSFDPTDIQALKAIPALKILGFFAKLQQCGSTAKYSTAASVKASATMSNLEPITSEQMRMWLQQIEIHGHD
ncbi:MAG: hypothetical protein Q9168_004840 [Polycauliona sp. 1 TL-2023]